MSDQREPTIIDELDLIAPLYSKGDEGKALVAEAKEWVRLYDQKKGVERELNEVKAQLALAAEALVGSMLEAGVQGIKTAGRNVFVQNNLHVKSKDKDHAGLARACFDSGRPDLIVIGTSRLKSECGDEEALAGLPPAILAHLDVYKVPVIGSRKA